MEAILAPLFAAAIALAIFLLWRSRSRSERVIDDYATRDVKVPTKDPYEDIEPLPDFDWSTTKPIQIRPFKEKYHLTMALENCPLSDLVVIDDTYLERKRLRKGVMDENYWETVRCNPVCEPAVMELYEWIIGTLLPNRFPTMYSIVEPSQLPPDMKTSGTHLYVKPTNEYVPVKASSPLDALYTLGEHVDDEFLLLLPTSKIEDGSPIYHLEGYVCCFPSGFSTPDKFAQSLAGIHKPVPGYKAKLEKSMDRFFAKLESGKAVKRTNWSLTTDSTLFKLSGNHMYAGGTSHSSAGSEAFSSSQDPIKPDNEKTLDLDAPDLSQIIEEQKKGVVIEDCRLRCERQTLHRLPRTRAVIFAFKTYLYTLDQIKAEGMGPEMADAAEGLSKGSVPDMAFYKRQVVWGDKVCEYLRN